MVESSGEVRVVMRWWSRRWWRPLGAGVRWRLAARGLLKVFVVGGVVVLVPAAPAEAHTLGPSGSSNYRSALVSVSPRVDGLRVRVVDDGQHVELTNSSELPVVVLGYDGEPYLMVDRRGVWENVRSPSLYLNRVSTPTLVAMPAGVSASASPRWQAVCRCDTARWHDHRIHWGQPSPPDAVQAAPGRYHFIETWHLLVRDGARTVTVTGTLAWVPGPSPAPWFALAGTVAVGVLLIGFVRRWRVPLAAALGALVVADVLRAVGMVTGRSGSFHNQLGALPDDGIVGVIAWVGAAFLVVWALRGRIGAAWGAAWIGLWLGIDGVPTAAVMWRSQVVTGYPTWFQRALVAVTVGLGLGLFAAGLLLVRRIDRPARKESGAWSSAGAVALSTGDGESQVGSSDLEPP